MSATGGLGRQGIGYDITVKYGVQDDSHNIASQEELERYIDDRISGLEERVEDDVLESLELQKERDKEYKKERTGEGFKKINKRLKDVEGKINQAVGAAQNPAGAITNQILDVIGSAGPHGKIAATLIGVVLGTPILARKIIKMIAVKGGDLNRDFHDIVEDATNSLFSREDLKQRLLGNDSAVVFSQTGFRRVAEGEVYDTRYDLDSSRLARIGTAYRLGVKV